MKEPAPTTALGGSARRPGDPVVGPRRARAGHRSGHGRAPLTPDAVRRRFVGLSALRWLPTGFLIPVTVVLMQSRGLSLAEIGLVAATQSVVVLVLELPTGGLADAVGRRVVLVLGGLLELVALALLASARSTGGFMLAWGIQGVYRALESGPLEAWFVDASLTADPRAPIERGLSRAATATGVAISLGALGAGGLAIAGPVAGVDPLVAAVLVALVLQAIDLAAITRFVTETHARGGRSSRVSGVAAALGRVPTVVRDGVRLVTARRALLALVTVELLWGAGMVAVELFSGPRLVDLLGDPERGVAVLAVTAAAGWSICGVGAALTGSVVRVCGGRPAGAGAVLRLGQGLSVAVIAAAGPAALVAGYLGFYLVHGAANVVHYGMVHRLVGPEHRTTIVSANSLASRLGAAGAAIGLGAVAANHGIPIACAIAALLLAAGAPLYRIAGRERPAVEAGEALVPPQPVDPPSKACATTGLHGSGDAIGCPQPDAAPGGRGRLNRTVPRPRAQPQPGTCRPRAGPAP